VAHYTMALFGENITRTAHRWFNCRRSTLGTAFLSGSRAFGVANNRPHTARPGKRFIFAGRYAKPNTYGDDMPLMLARRLTFEEAIRLGELSLVRICDLRSTYEPRLSAGGVADEWVTQLFRQGEAKVFKRYSQMKLQMKREALQKLDRKANEGRPILDTRGLTDGFLSGLCRVRGEFGPFWQPGQVREFRKWFKIKRGCTTGA